MPMARSSGDSEVNSRSVPFGSFRRTSRAERFEQRMSIYADAGYGDAGQVDNILAEARSGHDYEAGRIIRNFVEYFARD